MVFRAVVFKLLVWCGVEGYMSSLRDVAKAIPQAATTVKFSLAPDDGHSGARNMLSKQ